MDWTNSPTLVKLPARTQSSVKSRKNRSTRFIHELEVGVKSLLSKLAENSASQC